jgi:hypothetical protein
MTKITEIASKLFDLLEPLGSDERKRVVQAAFTLLGDAPSDFLKPVDHEEHHSEKAADSLPPRAKSWAKQNGVSYGQLEQVFQIEGQDVEIIGSDVPGNNSKDKTHGAYVLAGIAALLANGEPKFDDEAGRSLCKSLGCFNEANHSAYMKDKGNDISGSKEKGWALTAPGLKRGATIIKALTNNADD